MGEGEPAGPYVDWTPRKVLKDDVFPEGIRPSWTAVGMACQSHQYNRVMQEYARWSNPPAAGKGNGVYGGGA